MADAGAPASALDLLPGWLDRIFDLLRRVGVDVSPGFMQASLLVLAVVPLALSLRHLRAHPEQRSAAVVGAAAALGLVTAGVLLGWVVQLLFPLPTSVEGAVRAPRDLYPFVRVQLLGFGDDVVSVERGFVDSQSGRFALTYRRRFGDRPRAIRVTTAERACAELRVPLSRAELRASKDVHLEFQCLPRPA